MKKTTFPPFIVIGITLFSMFFGAGNLIFAPFLGVQAGTAAPWALLGFVCTAVVMPILAVIIISRYETARKMISTISPAFASFFMVLVYLLIGPCIAIPRTASTSYEMFGWLLPDTMLWQIIYTVVFFGAAAITAYRPGALKDVLGKVMGPILVAMVLVLTLTGLFMPSQTVSLPTEAYASPFMTGFTEGYQTMDILAAFCFCIVLVLNIRSLGIESKAARVKILRKAAFLAGSLLALLYVLLGLCGMKFSQTFVEATNGAQILSRLAFLEFGNFGSVFISLIFLAACYNVCSGLLSCCSEFFFELTGKMSYPAWLAIFTLAGICFAIGGLDWILSFSAPILQIMCPAAIILMGYGWLRSFLQEKKQMTEDCSEAASLD